MHKNVLEKVEELLAKKDEAALRKELLSLSIFDAAKIINRAERGKRKLFILLPPEIQAEAAVLLNRKTKKTILPRLGNLTIARFMHFMDSDSDVVDVLQFVPEKRQAEVIYNLAPNRRAAAQKLLKYPHDTAGGIMDYNFIIVSEDAVFHDVRGKMERHEKDFQKIPSVIIEDKNKKITGYLPLQKIIFAESGGGIKKFVRAISLIKDTEGEEELIKYILEGEQILGVIDESGDFAGVIKIEDLAQLSLQGATEDIYGFAGVAKEEDIFDAPSVSIKRRSRWLLVHLGTAFLAAAVVGLFQDTISKLVLLAVYMPVVASMGGNAATQTLAVTVRSMALGDATFKNGPSVLRKEFLTSLGNGIIVGSFAALVAYILNFNPLLGAVLFLSLTLNLVIAGFFGALVPLTLKFFKIDPALAASTFVIAATDIFGFFVFLGLAEILLI